MVMEDIERKMLEKLIISKLISLSEVSRSYTLKKPKGHPIADSIETKVVTCEWESDILGKLLQKL